MPSLWWLQVAQKAETNKMTPANIATVFGPNLAWSKGQANLSTVEPVIMFTQLLIQNFDDVFLRWPSPCVKDLQSAIHHTTLHRNSIIWRLFLCYLTVLKWCVALLKTMYDKFCPQGYSGWPWRPDNMTLTLTMTSYCLLCIMSVILKPCDISYVLMS